MAKLNTVQEMHLKNVQDAHTALFQAKRSAQERAKRLVDEAIAAHQAHLDRQVRIAFEAGVPKSQIGRFGLLTSAPKTVNDSLARTEGLMEATTGEVTRYAWTGERDVYGRRTILVTMHGDEWDAWVEQHKQHFRRADLADRTTAHFWVTEDGKVGTSEEDNSGALKIDNPVIAWHKRDGFKEIQSWVDAQSKVKEAA